MGGAQFWFGFTQLAPFFSGMDWGHGADGWQDIREAQLAALDVANVGFVSAVDVGDPLSPMGSYHPRNKQAVGLRLANAALAMVYGNATQRWRGPQLLSASIEQAGTAAGSAVTVTAFFDNAEAGLAPRDYACPTDLGVDARVCSDFSVYVTPGDGAPAATYSFLGGGFLGTAGTPCGSAMHTIASAMAACDALPPDSPACPQGCKGFFYSSNETDPGVPVMTTFCSVLDFFPETGRAVNYQSWGKDVDFRGVKLAANLTSLAGNALTFTALTMRNGQRATAAAYGWATWPVSVVMNSDGLPMVPWLSSNVSGA